MESLYLLIPLSIMVVAFAVWIFFGAADSGQFDDLESPGWRILGDDDGVALRESPQGAEPGVGVKRALTPELPAVEQSCFLASVHVAAENRGQSPLKSNTGL